MNNKKKFERKINYETRKQIQKYINEDYSYQHIAKILNLNCSTVVRELYRCPGEYDADEAEKDATKKRFYKRNKEDNTEILKQVVHYSCREWCKKFGKTVNMYYRAKLKYGNLATEQVPVIESLEKNSRYYKLELRVSILEQQIQTMLEILKEIHG